MPDQTVHCVVERAAKLSEPTRKTSLHDPLAYDNAYAHSMRYRAFNDDGTEADLTGYSVVGAFTPSGHNTIKPLLNGTVTGNVAELILPSACYKHPGRFKFTMNLNKGSVSRSVLWVEGMVERNQTDTIEAPTEVLDVSQVIEDAQTAAAEANAARDRANTLANTLVNDSVNAISTAAAQQRQSVNDLGDQLKGYLEDHYGETTDKVKTKANRSSVSTVKHAIGADGKLTLTDALNEPAKKMTIHLEPKQDLHGYDKPWVGGAGKNLLPMIGNTATWAANANSTYTATDEQLTIVMTDDTSSGVYTRGSSDIGQVIASLNGVYTWSIDLKAAKSVRIVIGIQGTLTITTSVGTDWQRFSGTATFTGARNPFVIYNNGGSGTATTVYARNIMIESGSVATTYEPYSNICPIEGFDSVEVVGTDVNIYDKSQVIYGKNWLNGNSANRAVFVAKTEKGKTLHLRATQHGNTHRIVIVGANKFDSNAVQSFNKNFQPGLSTISYEVTADEYVICQFERYNDAANADVTPEDIDVWNIAISYSDINSVSLNLVSSAGSTVYGGTVTVNEDGSGTLVVDRVLKQVLSSDIKNSSAFLAGRYLTSDNYVIDKKSNSTHVCNAFSSSILNNTSELGVCYFSNSKQLICNTSFTSIDDFKAWIDANGLHIVYQLDIPLLYPLTATQLQTLVGTNHVFTDGTNIELDYYGDKYCTYEQVMELIANALSALNT